MGTVENIMLEICIDSRAKVLEKLNFVLCKSLTLTFRSRV